MFTKIATRIRLSSAQISLNRKYASKVGWGRFTKPERSADGFYIDTRQGQRQVLKDWVSRNGHKYRFEIADDTDFDMATAFWAETFNKTSNIVEKLDPEEHELYPVLVPMAEFMIAQRNIIMCFDEGNRLVGTGMGGMHDAPEFDHVFGRGEVGLENPKASFKSDYAKDAEKLPYSPKMNIVIAFIRACCFQTLPFLTKTTKRVAIIEAAAIHPALQAEGIGSAFVPCVTKHLAVQKPDVIVSLCVAAGSYKIASKMGAEILFELPYDQFKVNGEPVFTDLCDGATKAAMFAIKFN